jgi:trafficking protein particle complex subunit 11
LTPSSPLYPDGIITPLWITKHQSRLPAVFITFFALSADPNTSSLRDNQIKTEVANIRGVFASTNYKTKVVVVLIGESGADPPFDLEERLGSIRKTTGLDSRHLFYFAPESSDDTVNEFVKSILTSLQSFCVEYYRDLSKHTRRKRSRTNVPPPTIPPTLGTSQTLPLPGWNVRYEFKLGVFAEFRQEMDAACRNYESAYEGLFSHEIFETISSWSPRFNEARLLADAIAIRILRCLLWTGQPTSAARFWTRHRNRIRDLVNRRGKGSENYGWEAWEAIWSKSFAQAVAMNRRVDSSPSDSAMDQQFQTQFSLPERSIPIGERVAPWELLHHDGYWWNRAWKHVRQRRKLAHQMPEEDRTSPGQSPASAIANRSHLYDSYLAPEPHVEYPLDQKSGYNYSSEILDTITAAIRSYSQFQQHRFVEQLRLEEAKEHLEGKRWHECLLIMRSIWPCLSWRKAGWWKMVVEAAWILREAAKQTSDGESLLRLEWEAYSSAMPVYPDWEHDLESCLDDIDLADTKPSVVITSEDCLSPVWASLHFASFQGNVGEPLKTQLVLISTAHKGSAPIHLSDVKIVFEGGLRPIRLLSDDSETCTQVQSTAVSELRLRESSSSTNSTVLSPTAGPLSLVGMADITIHPGKRKVFDMICTPREAGEVRVASINLLCETAAFSLTYVISQQTTPTAKWWSIQDGQPHCRKLGRDRDASTVRILPKPPKVRIDVPKLRSAYYTGEKITLDIVIRNEEAEAADVTMTARLLSPVRHQAAIGWEGISELDSFGPASNETDVPPKKHLVLPNRSVGVIQSDDSHSLSCFIDRTQDAIDHELELTANYHLLGDPESALSRTISVALRVSGPFEANYEFLPRLDPTPWPNFFDPTNMNIGLSQRFLLVAKMGCFVTEPVIIEEMSLHAQEIVGNAVCIIDDAKTLDQRQSSEKAGQSNRMISPQEIREYSFELLIQKNSLGDSHSVAFGLKIAIKWKRSAEAEPVTSTLDIPRSLIPMTEPRVLLSKRQAVAENHAAGLVHLQYTIENPSMHYLTFNLTMESSDEFAFSGPKATSFSLVPISRRHVAFRILAHQPGRWVRVGLAVVDAYFNKALRVSAASGGVRSDGKRGLLVWVD